MLLQEPYSASDDLLFLVTLMVKNMKSIVFDSGPIINMAMNNLLWLLEPLKKQFKGTFFVGHKVKEELVDYPLHNTQKFRFEALQTLRLFDDGILEAYPKEHAELANKLLTLFNSVFHVKSNPLNIVHAGETEAIAIALSTGNNVVVIDERTVRLIIENPQIMARILEKKLHSKVKTDYAILGDIKRLTKELKIIRSVELVIFAFEQGLLDKYLPTSINQPKKTLLDAVVWGLKLNGCSMTLKEMDIIKKIET